MSLLRRALILSLLAAGASLVATGARADGTATTLLDSRPYVRDGGSQQTPVYEAFSLSARPDTPEWLQDVRIAARGWGRLTLGEPFDGNRLAGDLDSFFLEGQLLKRRLFVRVGRQLAVGGALRATQLDGVYARGLVKAGLGAEVWGGAPVAPRFGNWNSPGLTSHGDALAGGRVFLRKSFDAEVGASFLYALRGGYLARKDLALDGTWSLNRAVSFNGLLQWSLEEQRLAEARLQALWQVSRKLEFVAEAQRTAPDLFLDRSSIFAVFSEELRDEVGGEVVYRVLPLVSLTGDWHAFDGESGGGQRAGARATVHTLAGTSVGAELRLLTEPGNGYKQARVFGLRKLAHDVTLTVDLDAYWLEHELNAHMRSLVAQVSGGWAITPAWEAMVSASLGRTPLYEQRAELVARVVYKFGLPGGMR